LKQHLQDLLKQAMADSGLRDKSLSLKDEIQIEKTRDGRYGDFASNIAMVIAAQTGRKPRELAEDIARHIPPSDTVERIEVAGNGFINFFIDKRAYLRTINDILESGKNFGRSDFGREAPLLVEFVSANPTGPLHIGHGRGAAYGAAVANLLEAVGYRVDREYYVNDAGRQMDILAVSVWLRYLELRGLEIGFPGKAYQGDYVKNIAGRILREKGDSLLREVPAPTERPERENDGEKQLDRWIAHARTALGADDYRYIFNFSLNEILDDIRADLEEFGIRYDNWFSESSLAAGKNVDECINQLRNNGYLREKDNALWFASSQFGDEKDRVVVRDNGQATYFAADIAYHRSKFTRGYKRAIDIWGADHHGYMARIKAALNALGEDPEKLDILLVQFASLYRGGQKVQMSTRSGQFVTLRELREEVGNDAARFFYVMRKSDQHLDFDLELAKAQTNDNPVYYIQYAHARICSVLRQMREKGYDFTPAPGSADLEVLTEPREQVLLMRLSDYPGIVHAAATGYEPHQVAYYLRELANEFHTYYNACQFLVDTENLRKARLSLVCAVGQVIRNGLELLGVSAPERM